MLHNAIALCTDLCSRDSTMQVLKFQQLKREIRNNLVRATLTGRSMNFEKEMPILRKRTVCEVILVTFCGKCTEQVRDCRARSLPGSSKPGKDVALSRVQQSDDGEI